MRARIIDLTDDKILLFLPALNALHAAQVSVTFETRHTELVEQLKHLSPEMFSEPGESADVHIFVIGDLQQAQQEKPQGPSIFYPIVSKKESWPTNQPQDTNVLRVPLGDSTLLGHFFGDPESLVDFVRYFATPHLLKGKNVLISAGPTAEDLDPVRFLTNRSSGKMGIALARAAFIYGAEVTLIMGPGEASIPAYIRQVRVRSAAQMARAVAEHFDQCDIYIGAAAVADFTPQQIATEKIKKRSDGLHLPLKRTIDILQSLAAKRKQQILVGFSVETEKILEHSLRKLQNKHLDLIVVNNPKEKGAAFGQETNKVYVIQKNGQIQEWPLMPKFEVSLKIMQLLAKMGAL